MRVAAYTGGVMVPSARARVRQYIAPLSALGISVREYPLPLGNILPRTPALRPVWMTATAAVRVAGLAASWTTDVTWVSRQLLPAFAPLEWLARKPLVLDVDDAIWLNTGGQRAKVLARAASLVVCGNTFLADQFSLWNKNVAIIPTAVDTAWYTPKPDREQTEAPVLGWTGTSGNFPFLYAIEPALLRVLEQCPHASLLVIADRPPVFKRLPPERVEFQAWSPAIEHAAFARFSIGLMPLADTAWCNGKCSYKMLCYMAAGLPVVVTAAGMNREVLAMGNIGLSAEREAEWVDALLALLENPRLRRQMGDAGRTIIEERFSLHRLAQQYAQLFHSLGGQAPRGSRSPVIIPERPILL